MIFSLLCTAKFGDFEIFYQTNPFLVVKIHLPAAEQIFKVNEKDKRRYKNHAPHEKAALVKNLIMDYCRGMPINTPWELLDLEYLTRLQQAVLIATADIQYGRLKSYKEIAAAIGRPGAHRFVGSTLAKNRFPILIPCHRVIRSDGSTGMFGGGAAMKKKLLEHEKKCVTFFGHSCKIPHDESF